MVHACRQPFLKIIQYVSDLVLTKSDKISCMIDVKREPEKKSALNFHTSTHRPAQMSQSAYNFKSLMAQT